MAALVRGNWVFVWLTALTVLLAYVGWTQAAAPEQKVASFDELDVQRINIAEPDGKPRVVISSRKRMPGLYWGGKEYKHHSRDDGGFLFFNDEGDEVGGMTFSNRTVKNKDGSTQSGAGSSLLFDQYKQDQTVGLQYREENGKRSAGLRVWQRPDQSLFPIIELSDKAARAGSDAERDAIRKQMMEIAKGWGPVGERVFAGKEADDAIVRLADQNTRPRLVLRVDGAGEPSVEFLDEAGKVARRITAQ